MLRRWWFGVTIVASIALSAPPALAQLPAPPTVSTPQTTVPPVTTPSATVPSVTTPAATTPSVTAPSVTTPPLTTPSVTTPSTSGSGSTSSGSGSPSSGSESPSSGSSGGGGTSGSGGSSTASGPASSTAPSGPAGASGPTHRPAPRRGTPPAVAPDTTPVDAGARDRALRRAVLRLEGCLSRVPRTERRVLRLRAGMGIRRVRSRTEVARLTGLRRERIAALERDGLKRLRALSRAGKCSSTSAGSEQSTGATGAENRAAPGLQNERTPGVAVLGTRTATGRDPAQPPPGNPPGDDSSSRSDDGRPFLQGPDSALDLAPLVLALALAGMVFAAVREARRGA